MEPLFLTCEEKRRRWLAHQELTQQERSINDLVIECRSVFLAELAGNERAGRLAGTLFLFEHSFDYLRGLAVRLGLHRVYA